MDFLTETYQLPDGSFVNCEIFDTGGQEKYDALNRRYYQRADCCVLVYDITNPESFEDCKHHYKNEIRNNCKKDVKVILVGNKKDLEGDRKVSEKEGAEFAEESDYLFKETSCETSLNVADVFETIIIMTNNDMIKTHKQNFAKKKKIKTPEEYQKKNKCC